MVKREAKSSISEDDGAANPLNENGKRSIEAPNKEGKKRLKTKSLYRQPTVNELNRLQETENLFNSNLFRLQVEEILQEVHIKEKTEKKFQDWFEQFNSHLQSIPEDDTEYDLTESTLTKKLKVKLPIGEELKKTKCVFRFHKFNNVEIVGSYALGCSINSKLRIDLQITVPAETYTKNDSINYRYHKKRAAYLAYIASHLKKLDIIDEVQYSWLNGSQTKPVIDLKPTGKLANHFAVRINLVCEAEAYKFHRFSPTRNNLREAWLFEEPSDSDTAVGPSTPCYNNTVLSDLTASANQQFLKDVLLKSDNLKQAIVLLKIWLRQRRLNVSGHVISLFVAYLVQTKRINNIMSSYQIVRNVWIALKMSEWDTKGITLHKGSDAPPLTEFTPHSPVVFTDVTGHYNTCYDMCLGTYHALKRESSLAVDMLDNGKINSFYPLFMVRVDPLMMFDHIVRFKNITKLKESITSRAPKETRMNYGVDQLHLVTNTLYSTLARGLGARVDLILQLVEADFSWTVKKRPEKAMKDGYEEKLSFGLILNPENALNIVDKGPSANLPEAEEFRSFWGEKSELRRFQDGAITEACVWPADTLAERRAVTKQILDYLIQYKYGIPPSEVFHICDQLEGLLAFKQYVVQCEESSMSAVRAFDELRHDLRSLTQLPLDVSAVYGVSPVFSYSDPLPPVVQARVHRPWQRGLASLIKHNTEEGDLRVPPYTPVCKAIVELGHSGKWPGELTAFRCLKAAFHLQLSERLTKQHSLPSQAYPTHVDLLKNGLVFRLQVAHPKEITLLRREVVRGVVRMKETEESVKLEFDTVVMPRLRGALHGLHQKHPAFGPTSCLVKRWLSSHLLSPPHFPSTMVELVCAAVFLRPEPLSAPAHPTAGFVRAITLLADTDWRNQVIVLDFNGDMTREEISSLERNLSSREPGSAYMRVVTSHDGPTSSASLASPDEKVVLRAQSLARTTLRYLEDALLSDMKEHVLGAFVPSLSGYDVIIHLLPHLVPYCGERVDKGAELRSLPETVADDIVPVVEFHPVERYLEELRHIYGEFALFFNDCYGGELVAVLWRPDVKETREFQLLNANALKPIMVKGEVQYRINTEAMVEDFRILGDGLVRDITVNS